MNSKYSSLIYLEKKWESDVIGHTSLKLNRKSTDFFYEKVLNICYIHWGFMGFFKRVLFHKFMKY